MKNILIIGGNGYIGNRLYKDYHFCYNITSVDICWFNNPLFPTFQTDFNSLTKEFLKKFDVIILLAGHSSVKMCEGPLISAHNNNIRNFIELASKLNQSQKLIYASSSSVYGNTGEELVDETYNNFIPYNHYDTTKYIVDIYASKFDIQYYGLRFGTVNGYSPIVRKDIMINAMVYNAFENN